MDEKGLQRASDPQYFADDIMAALGEAAGDHGHHHGGPLVTERRDSYRGHEILIRTTYEIEVDGSPLETMIQVGNGGQVLTHGLPNYSFPSAVALVRELIDVFPEDFPPPQGAPHEHDPAGHHGHGG
jgi:hypothetical protein